jgi:DNA-binding transcriptional ArsR family regulator
MHRKTYGLSADQAARLFDVLGQGARVRMLLLLAKRGEASSGDLHQAAGRTHTNTSAHLGVLRRTGVVERRRDGQRVFYRLTSSAAADVLRLVCGA